jgi:hypothetical protein
MGMTSRREFQRPRRTREHIIASQSVNYVEGIIIDRGHTAEKTFNDYGIDLLVNTYDAEGYLDGGEAKIQIKASDRPRYNRKSGTVACKVEARHMNAWQREPMPVFLVIFDAQKRIAFWIDVQRWLEESQTPLKQRTLTIQIPLKNEFTGATVDHIRQRKQAVIQRIWKEMDL